MQAGRLVAATLGRGNLLLAAAPSLAQKVSLGEHLVGRPKVAPVGSRRLRLRLGVRVLASARGQPADQPNSRLADQQSGRPAGKHAQPDRATNCETDGWMSATRLIRGTDAASQLWPVATRPGPAGAGRARRHLAYLGSAGSGPALIAARARTRASHPISVNEAGRPAS